MNSVEIPLLGFLLLSAILFGIGLAIVLIKKNPILILLGVELMMVAGNINLVAFGRNDVERSGVIFGLFNLILGVCELAVGMAIIIQSYNYFKENDFSDLENHED
ncbi:MAG: hypothetical protein RIR51_829 [Bacteroidota bacterium]|jgi:NADH-quinone oxidoreductase subunit K